LKKAEDVLRREYSRKSEITVEKVQTGDSRDFYLVTAKGPEYLFEHGSTSVLWQGKNLSIGKRVGKTDRYRVVGSSRKEVVDHLAKPIIIDLIQQDIYSTEYGFNYLTDRETELRVLESTNDDDARVFSKAIAEGFSHSLPFVQKVSLGKLLKLRQEEGESFQVYRDAVAGVLRNLKPADAGKIKQAFEDEILPEVRKVDLAVSNAKRMLGESIATNIIFGTGLVTIGLATGFLPPDIGKIVAAIGGVQSGMNALQNLRQLVREPNQIRDNKFYFLWKVKQKAN
jgi:hypothetical protein